MGKNLVIIPTGGRNFNSIIFAINRIDPTIYVQISHDLRLINQATHIILPGVGGVKTAMQIASDNNLSTTISNLSVPVLGICLGMQILYTHSQENNGINCLNIVDGKVDLIPNDNVIVPHMGWNTLTITKSNCQLLKNINNNEAVYYTHSYYCHTQENTVATTNYGVNITAVMQKNNFFGTQFHPERSGVVGQQILENFLNL